MRNLSFDLGIAENHGGARNRRAALTSIAGVIARGTTFLTTIVTLPLVLHYLGTERFGLWMTISSFYAMLGFADLGIGNGLLTEIASARGVDDFEAVRRNITSAFAMLTVLAVVITVIMGTAIMNLDWSSILGLRDPLAVAEARPALLVFIICFAAGIPLGVVSNTQLGLQLGFLTAIWQAIGSILSLLAIVVVIQLHGSLPFLLGALVAGPLFASVVNGLLFFGWSHVQWRPNRKNCSTRIMRRLLRNGLLYFILQISMAIAYASDNAILAREWGASAVGNYAIVAKLFTASAILVGIVLQPLWPAYSDAIARGEFRWIKHTLLRSSWFVVAVSAMVAAILVGFTDTISGFWLHRSINASLPLLLGMAIWSVVDALGVSLAMLLNAAHVVRLQVILALSFAVTCFAVKIWLVGKFGAVALPWVTVALYIPISLVPILWAIRRWISNPSTPTLSF